MKSCILLGGGLLAGEMKALVVDGDPVVRSALSDVLGMAGFSVAVADDAVAAGPLLAAGGIDALFVDIRLAGPVSGRDLLRDLQTSGAAVLTVVLAANATPEEVFEATRLGAADVLTKPFASLQALAAVSNRVATQIRARRAPPEASEHDAFRDVGILVVDDDPSVRFVLTELFSEESCVRVEEAEAPFIALEKTARKRFDLLFVDIHMPGMTGIELLRQLRRANSECEVVIMTANPTVETAAEAAKLGVADYLRKPFSSLDDVLALQRRLADRIRERWSSSANEPVPPTGQVTLVFSDVQGSTRLWEKLPEAMRTALFLHERMMRGSIASFGGYEVKTEGDSFMVAFHAPMDAVRFCLDVQRRLLGLAWPDELLRMTDGSDRNDAIWRGLRVRMGAHAGKPDCRLDPVTGRMDYFGPDVNRASRVMGSANGGQILVTEVVWNEIRERLEELDSPHVEDLGERRLKDLDAPVRVVQVLPRELGERSFATTAVRTDAGIRVPSGATKHPDPAVGGSWGPYLVSQRLDSTLRDSSADVLLVRRIVAEGLGEMLVLKRFRPDLSADARFAEALLEDSRVAARLAHANVVRIFDMGKFGDQLYIGSEYVQGWSLRTFLEASRVLKMPVPPAFACRILADVCSGLSAAHRGGAGLVHRDVSPSTILLGIDGVARLADLGVARAIDALPQVQPGMLRASTAYMAPEQLAGTGATVDARADIFGAGAVLWECAIGEPLFQRTAASETTAAVLQDPIPLLRSVRPDALPEIEEIVRTALERDRARRYPVVSAMLADLEKVVQRAASRRLFLEYCRLVFRKAVERGFSARHASPSAETPSRGFPAARRVRPS